MTSGFFVERAPSGTPDMAQSANKFALDLHEILRNEGNLVKSYRAGIQEF